jgi:radical SAM protein with 4Fe4S-binding SPASM domain
MVNKLKARIERTEWLLPLMYRYKRLKRHHRIRAASKVQFPESLVFETTNICNIGCIKCPRHELTRPLGFMEFDLFKRLIDESLQYGKRKSIGVVMMGEATLHPQFIDMVRYMSDNDAAEEITLNTNALTLDEDYSRQLIESGLHEIRFSVDASTAETYKLLMLKDRFDKFIGNIDTFLATKEKMGARNPRTIVRVTLSEENEEELQDIEGYWQGRVDHFEVVPAMNWAGAVSLKSPHPMPETDRASMGPCTELWHTMYIYQDGEIALCCVDWDKEFELGDVAKHGLFKVWNNESFQKIRDLHLRGDFEELPYCDGCNVRAIR